ncbi:MAG: SpoIIE family protein phosphatase [Bacteroidia bacterium]|nr:SpoIIE family protein phosphatase [Bacteroidia bacterium]MDW8157417.1 SpoIIE family protein phosphatase [Bacteroidia bacterium]
MNISTPSNILIIEDKPLESQLSVQKYINNCRIWSATSNTEEVFSILETQPLGLILLGRELNNEESLRLLQKIKSNPRFGEIPVIILTTKFDSFTNYLELAFENGAFEVLHNPIDPTELAIRINKCLQISNYIQNIKTTLNDLSSSIIYASRLQNALLPNQEVMDRFFSDYFIIYEPKDILSGDFFWFEYKRSDFIIAVGDCTGHGVPGAFMSILGINFLNQIFKDYGILGTDVMLEELNEKVCVMLKQTYGEYKGVPPLDGMDIALCHVNIDQHFIRFSGAHRPLYFFSQKQFHKIKGTPKSIGGTSLLNRVNFAYHDIRLRPDDTVYLFSDGITDQFDKNNYRRFGNRQWQELLEGIQEYDMVSQGEIIKRAIDEWKGNTPQTDDILIIGFRM